MDGYKKRFEDLQRLAFLNQEIFCAALDELSQDVANLKKENKRLRDIIANQPTENTLLKLALELCVKHRDAYKNLNKELL